MNMKKLTLVAAVLSLWIVTANWLIAQTESVLPAGVTRVTSVEGVTEYKLENGLHILLVPDLSTPRVTVNITYLVGSRHESYGETGMAHLLEHMNFKGTPSRSNIPDDLTKHGARTNATTSYDRTNYYETFAATDENLDWALGLEADRMVNSFIAKKDLDTEMTVVRNEFEMGENSPGSVLSERVLETAYIWHNYGHPTIGARADIENVPIERLQAFYHKYYQPDNAVLIVAGKIDENKTLGLIVDKFAKIPRPTRILPQMYTEEPAQDGEREVTLSRVGDVQNVMAVYHIPAAGHSDSVALDVLADILSDPAQGRLRKRLLDTKLATEAVAGVTSLHDPGFMWFAVTVPKDGNVRAAREELVKIAQGVAAEPITQQELDRIRAQDLEKFNKVMSSSSALALQLNESVANGDWRLFFWTRDQIKRTTLGDLQHAAEHYLVSSNLTLGIFIPDKKPARATIPTTPDYAERFKDYKGEPALAAGEPFDPTPANIETRTSRSSVGPIKLALLPKKTRGDVVNALLQIHFGSEESLANRAAAGDFAASLLMRGTAKHNMQQLSDVLTAIKTRMSIDGGPTGVTVRLQTDREHLWAALRLAAEMLKEPTFPESEFDEQKRNMLTSLEETRAEPSAVADLSLERALSPYPKGHVKYVPTLDESLSRIKATSLDDVKKFYRDFYGIGSAEVAIVGDFDPKDATSVINELFGKWKSPAAYSRVPSLFKAVTGKTESFNTPDKANAMFLVGTTLEMRDDNMAYPGLVLGNYILGGGFLNSRLAVRIRQKEGLSYSVGSAINASPLDKVGSFHAYAICAPQNYPKVVKAFNEELARALTEGYTAEELTTAKSGYLQLRQMARSEDGSLARGLVQHMFDDRDFRWDEQFESKIQALTSEQIHQAMKQFIDPSKLVIMGAGDFSKTEN